MNVAAGRAPAGRRFTLALAAALLALSVPVAAQPGTPPTVAVLSFHSPDATAPVVSALRRGLEERGWVDGRSMRLVSYSAGERRDRLAALAEELARQRVDVVVTGGDLALAAIQRATFTIPVVFGLAGGDPVALGFVASLARPGARLVGVAAVSIQLHRQRLELLRAVLPRPARVAVLSNAAHPPDARTIAELGVAAHALGLALEHRAVRDAEEIERVLPGLQAGGQVEGVLFMSDQTFFDRRARISDAVARSRLPALYPEREFVEAGGLIAGAVDVAEQIRRSARLVDEILKGTPAAQVRAEPPARLEVVLNLSAARRLGLSFRPPLLERARVIP